MVYLFVPESARYLALQNRPKEATEIANRIGVAMGYRGHPLQEDEVQYHHSSNKHQNQYAFPLKTNITLTVIKEKTIHAFQNIQKLFTEDIRNRTIILQLICMTLSFGAGLSTWINVVLKKVQVADVYMNSLYYSLASIPGNLILALLIDRMG